MNTLDGLFDDDEKLPAASASGHLIDSRVALAASALEHALGKRGKQVLKRGKSFAMVVTVPTKEWVEPIVSAIKGMSEKRIRLIDASEKQSARTGMIASSFLSSGDSVVGVSQAPASLLPQTLLSASTHEFVVAAPTAEVVASAMKKSLTGRIPPTFAKLDLTGLDFDVLCACLPRGTSKRNGVERLSRAVQQRPKALTAGTMAFPPLESAIEYGEARRWGLDLKMDIADLRAGKISWQDVDRGAILAGPPGCGKTTLAGILAQACGVELVLGSIPELFASSAGYLDSVIKAQRKLFKTATAKAPCILFLDEIDGLPDPAKMSPRGKDWWLPVVLDFYLLLDSAMSARDGVIVIGATNRLNDISPALLRPGRLERAIHIGTPDAEGLANILRTHLGGTLADQDLLPLARVGKGATAAMAMEWVRAARRASRRAERPLELNDLVAQIRAGDNRTEAERYRAAVHEAGHAVVGSVLGEVLEEVSIASRGQFRGWTQFQPTEGILDRLVLESRVARMLAGLVAEVEILGSASSGSGGSRESDLAQATIVLTSMHASFGMGETLLWQAAPEEVAAALNRDPALRTAVEADLQRLRADAERLVRGHRGDIDCVAKHLLGQGALSGDEVRKLISSS